MNYTADAAETILLGKSDAFLGGDAYIDAKNVNAAEEKGGRGKLLLLL